MDLVHPEIERYAEEHTSPHPPLLEELMQETRATLRIPEMLTGPVEGRFLQFLVWSLGARRVLELGTYSGYSALSMAGGLPEGGSIDTCELDEEHAAVARRYIERAGLSDRITVHVGPALETVQRLDGPWDFVFIDADKDGYLDYYELRGSPAEALRARADRRRQHAARRTRARGRHGEPVQRSRARRPARRVRAVDRARRRHPDPTRVVGAWRLSVSSLGGKAISRCSRG
jgi:predicted O-methyltransferase YrrM